MSAMGGKQTLTHAELALSCRPCSARIMEPLSPKYLADMAGQMASLSAFLGGFSATFLATLLALAQQRRLLTLTVALSCMSAVAFVVTVVAASMLSAILHADAPRMLAQSSAGLPRGIMSLAFGIGVFTLLLAIAVSGWLRTRATGWTSTLR